MFYLSSMDWEQREAMRFYTGIYKEVPRLETLEKLGVTLPIQRYHYLHTSLHGDDPDMVAFTESWEKGERDRQTRIKFGRYLRRFTELSDHDIGEVVAELRAAVGMEREEEEEKIPKLLFATDRETINEIFETRMCAKGASEDNPSCMYGKFEGKNRPYHVYANSPDVAVAYMVKSREIVARSVVSTKDKLWARVYAVDGDYDLCATFEKLLRGNGYRGPEALIGNRLSKVTSDYGDYIWPYIDPNGMDVNDEGDYWVIVRDGEYTCDCTDGDATQNRPRCEDCDELESNCECSYCSCCERHYPDGCDECSFCQQCEGCITHEACECERCSECSEILPNCGRSRYVDRCRCDRCGECGELESECECEEEEENNGESSEENEGQESEEREAINAE